MQERQKAGKSGPQRQKPRLPETLVEKITDILDYGQYIRTDALFNAALDGDVERIRQSIDDGAHVNATDKDGQTPLHYAIKHGTPEACALLIEKGADMEAKDKYGDTALHMAAERDIETCAVLVGKGIGINATNDRGHTPLFCAAWAGHIDICMLLIQNGADLTAKDNKSWSCWRKAKWAGHPDVADILFFFVRMRASVGKQGMISFIGSFRECIAEGS